jgi:hypothetical protein
MLSQAPIGVHFDLYAYWQAKRGGRSTPARSEINPADIPSLLPHLLLVERAGDQFRNRLIGTAVVREVGFDATGKTIGGSQLDPRAVAARAIYERVFTAGRPVFTTGGFVFKSGIPHAMSLLSLPLSNDGKQVNMALSSFVARFDLYQPSRGWLKDVPVTVSDIVEVKSAVDLERLCLAWEQQEPLVQAH